LIIRVIEAAMTSWRCCNYCNCCNASQLQTAWNTL